jgi:hypothetical protein
MSEIQSHERWFMGVLLDGVSVRIEDNEGHGHRERVFSIEDEAVAAYGTVVVALDNLAKTLADAGWDQDDITTAVES